MFSYQPSYYTTSPFDSYYVQPDPLRRAAAIQRQRELQAARLEQARREQSRLAEARRIQQLRRQQEEARLSEAYLQQLRNQRRSQYYAQQPVEEYEEDEGGEEMYSQRPFFPFAFAPHRRQQLRADRSAQYEHPPRQHSQPSTSPVSIPIARNRRKNATEGQKTASPRLEAQAPGLNKARLQAAATAIQSAWRSYALRKKALARISNIRDAYLTLQSSFSFPTSVDFLDQSSKLAYTPNNRPILSYEHAATRLLTELDAVNSAGDPYVRAARKALVNEIEDALSALESQKLVAWTSQQQLPLTSAPTHEEPITVTPVIESQYASFPSESASENSESDSDMKSEDSGVCAEHEESVVEAAVSEPDDIVIVDEEDADTEGEGDEEDAWVDASDEFLTEEDEKDAQVVEMHLDESSTEAADAEV